VRNFSIIIGSRLFMWINHITNCGNKVTNMFTFVAVDTDVGRPFSLRKHHYRTYSTFPLAANGILF
jgi:hypothetical protein